MDLEVQVKQFKTSDESEVDQYCSDGSDMDFEEPGCYDWEE